MTINRTALLAARADLFHQRGGAGRQRLAERHLCVSGPCDVVMKGFIIRNGHANSGGGIAAEGDLTLVSMTVKESNQADVRGGGVWGYGSKIVITNTLIMSNTAVSGGGIRIEGGCKADRLWVEPGRQPGDPGWRWSLFDRRIADRQ